MVKINDRLLKLEEENTFSNVAKKINEYKMKNPNANIISLGVGDVSKPIIETVIKAMHNAVDDLSDIETFKGYGAYYGYDFLKEKILENEYKDFNFSLEEIYISGGAKTDVTNILELFSINSKICLTNPMYPVYRDGSSCLNRNVYFIKATEEDNFISKIPKQKYDIIYICSPSNPLGIAYTYTDLEKWIKYALKNNAVILYDNVYEAFIKSDNVPHSIYEIEGAKKVAIELRSFSKKASFTGVRCSYYVIPNEIKKDINKLWQKRTINRFNGADYIAQRGAEAIYFEESKKLMEDNINFYLENAKILKNCFQTLGFKVWGGIDSPFMWVKIKENIPSWDYFDIMLEELNIIIIPGCIFGSLGDRYIRISALGTRDSVLEATERMKKYYEKEI